MAVAAHVATVRVATGGGTLVRARRAVPQASSLLSSVVASAVAVVPLPQHPRLSSRWALADQGCVGTGT